MARWYPASDTGASLEVAAFAAGSEAPSVPGPLLRVPVGTNVSVSVANALEDTLFVSGLRDPATWDTLVVPPGKRATARDSSRAGPERSSIRAGRAGTIRYGRGARASS